MIAVHFGAGNIGRGFIGSLLYQSGFTTCFIDVNEELVSALNQQQEYSVILTEQGTEEERVKNVQAINSQQNPEQVLAVIAEADLVTTAVGPNILPLIAGPLADALRRRLSVNPRPLNIIACENMIRASSFLREKVYEQLKGEEREAFERLFAFPDAAVDRIVPVQTNENPLTVMVEPFYEWIVEETQMVGGKLDITGMQLVSDLTPYIERKLFTVNTGHAVAAYFGYAAQISSISEVMKQEEISVQVEHVLNETGRLLCDKYKFDPVKHQDYLAKTLKRFANPHLSDAVTRVGRSPIRKLGPNDRLISPAKQYADRFQTLPVHLADGIAAALHYDFAEDPEAVTLQQSIRENGVGATLERFTGLDQKSELAELIVKLYHKGKKMIQADEKL